MKLPTDVKTLLIDSLPHDFANAPLEFPGKRSITSFFSILGKDQHENDDPATGAGQPGAPGAPPGAPGAAGVPPPKPHYDPEIKWETSNGNKLSLDGKNESGCKDSCESSVQASKADGSLGMLTNAMREIENCKLACWNAFDVMMCFSGDSTVLVRGRGAVRMEDLNVGDAVLTPEGFEEVLCFLHRHVDKEAEFIEVHYEGGVLTLTADHYVMVPTEEGKHSGRSARSLTTNDELSVVWIDCAMRTVPITDIKKVKKTGIYAPLTYSGALFVDHVYASCYAIPEIISENPYAREFDDVIVASHAALLPLRKYYSMFKLSPEEGKATTMDDYCIWAINMFFYLYGDSKAGQFSVKSNVPQNVPALNDSVLAN